MLLPPFQPLAAGGKKFGVFRIFSEEGDHDESRLLPPRLLRYDDEPKPRAAGTAAPPNRNQLNANPQRWQRFILSENKINSLVSSCHHVMVPRSLINNSYPVAGRRDTKDVDVLTMFDVVSVSFRQLVAGRLGSHRQSSEKREHH